MSSSSDAATARSPEPDRGPEENVWLAQLIRALANEVATLGEEITGVGDALSARVFSRGEIQGVKEMQSFDALSQLARAQARLLETISRQLGEPTSDMREALAAGIAGLPILEVRRRMLGAVNPSSAPDLPRPAAPDEDETWF